MTMKYHCDEFESIMDRISLAMVDGGDMKALTRAEGICDNCFLRFTDEIAQNVLAEALIWGVGTGDGEINLNDAVACGILQGFLIGLAFAREKMGVNN